ncbi:MAG: GAF domain-containing protein [Marinilabiliaceae bacterium]|nr:GAF domain-containing protein [Marinilabiliaceae bacterium]
MINSRIPKKYVLITVGTIVSVLTFVKFVRFHSVFHADIYILDFLVLIVLLGVTYYFDVNIAYKNKKLAELNEELERVKYEYGKRESDLLMKIMRIEQREREELHFTVNKEKTIAKLFKNIDNNDSNNAIAISFLTALGKQFEIVIGIFYLYNKNDNNYVPIAKYAIDDLVEVPAFVINEGFCGQAVADKKILSINEMPEDYFIAYSGLGEQLPKNLYFLPIIHNDTVYGLIEIGSFKQLELTRIWSDINNKLIDLLKLT